MITLGELDALESDLAPVPLFPVEEAGEKPDKRETWPESYRQKAFVSWLRRRAPMVVSFSIANERNVGLNEMRRLKAQGLVAGWPDVGVLWDGGWAFCEFKGWDAQGRPGKLSAAQVDACNRIHVNRHPVACFFRAETAWNWLRSVGCPLPELGG